MAVSFKTDARQESHCEAQDPPVFKVHFGVLNLLHMDLRCGYDAVLHIVLVVLFKVDPNMHGQKLAALNLGPHILRLPPGFRVLSDTLLQPTETLPKVLLLSNVCIFSDHSLHALLPGYRVEHLLICEEPRSIRNLCNGGFDFALASLHGNRDIYHTENLQ